MLLRSIDVNTLAKRLVSCSIITCLIAAITISGTTKPTQQTPHFERHLPLADYPRISVYNASFVSIEGWDKYEASIEAESSGGPVGEQEIRIQTGKNSLEIVCKPAQSGDRITLRMHLPSTTFLYLDTAGQNIEVRHPTELITVDFTTGSIDVHAPLTTFLDLSGAALVGDGHVLPQQVAYGPPFIRFIKTNLPFRINEHVEPPPHPDIVPLRDLTVAAQTIARRNGKMNSELRKSDPRLRTVYDDHTAGSPSESGSADDDVKLQSSLVNLTVTVTDRDGRAISNLSPEDLSVYEDGVLQSISHFSPEQTPFNLVLLLDMSGSVKGKRKLIEEAAIHFIDLINPLDKVAIVSFTTDVTVVSPLTQDHDRLRRAITKAEIPPDGTSFYDALGYVLVEELRKVRGERNAVVVMTDGEDNSLIDDWKDSHRSTYVDRRERRWGSFLTFDELLDGVKEADAAIYPINLNPDPILVSAALNPQAGPPNRSGGSPHAAELNAYVTAEAKKQLQELADATGGRVFNADKIEDLKEVYEQVAAELRTVYSVAYAPSNQKRDGLFRRIFVKVNQPAESVARTRKGYYAK